MQNLGTELKKYFSTDKLKLSVTDRYAFAGDASFYYLLPQAIVQPNGIEDIQQLFLFANQYQVPITFRAAGTSLSGQSITDGILVDLSMHWKKASPLQNGSLVKVQPGVICAHVNHQLLSYGAKIGPDPASINAAMMGGVLSNNSSGMCCGVTHNSYHTLHAIQFVLPNGNVYDTAKKEDYHRFTNQEEIIVNGLISLQNKIVSNRLLVQKIKEKYRIKNTVGYSINAFIDYTHPLDILAHLLIGAEGTLAFIAEAVLQTIPDKPFKSTALLFFENPEAAAESIPALKATNAEALELMDRPALHSIEHMDYCPDNIKRLPDHTTAILCEYQASSKEGLSSLLETAMPVIQSISLVEKPVFSEDKNVQAKLWKLRKGLYPSVAAVRAKGTTAMLEDVAVPLEKMGNAITDLHVLFTKFGYVNAIIFGHAKEGNLHFLVTQPVNAKEDIALFELFNSELAALIINKYNGSLKAEHGTGRQIAPFVKDEWGDEAYSVMQQLKKLLDPNDILNPGVIINADPTCHLKNMKSMPIVDEEVDKCVECGYCENRCPSRGYTLTPRQRIQIRRSMHRLKLDGDKKDLLTLQKEFRFSGMDTCAVDGMCATDCPVSINTGDLIKRLRSENHSAFANNVALKVSAYFGWVERIIKVALYIGNTVNRFFGKNSMHSMTGICKKMVNSFPIWTKSISSPLQISGTKVSSADIVYFPTCITRMMGEDCEDEMPIHKVLITVCKRAGLTVFIANNTTGVCCGQLFSSKGFLPAYTKTVNETIVQLYKWTNEGSIPLLMDVTSCTYSLQSSYAYLTEENKKLFSRLTIIDSIDFVADYLLPKININKQKENIVFHPVCTTYKMNLLNKLKAIGEACAKHAEIPFLNGCCGMAGDRGFYFPQLTETATKAEAMEVLAYNKKQFVDGYYSSGKTCEMAMNEATGKNYQSIFYLIRDVTEGIE